MAALQLRLATTKTGLVSLSKDVAWAGLDTTHGQLPAITSSDTDKKRGWL